MNKEYIVTILILIDGFLQLGNDTLVFNCSTVTILILIDGFLQFENAVELGFKIASHNPYFNRWFSAIKRINYNKTSIEQSQSLF